MAKPDPKDRGKAKIEDGRETAPPPGGAEPPAAAESGPLASSSYSADPTDGFTAEPLPVEDPIPLAREEMTGDEHTDISLWSAINPADWNWAVFSPTSSLGYGGLSSSSGMGHGTQQGSSQQEAPFRQALFVPGFATYPPPSSSSSSSSQMWMSPEAGQWGWQGHGMQHLPHTQAGSVPYQGYRGPPPPSSSSQMRMSPEARQWVMAAPYYPQQQTHPYSYANTTHYLGYAGSSSSSSSSSSQMGHGPQQQPARGVQAGSAARRRRNTSVWRRRTASNLQQTRPSTSSTASSEPDQQFELSEHDFPLAQEGLRILPPKGPGC